MNDALIVPVLIYHVSESNLNTRNTQFVSLLDQVETMSDEQRRTIADGREEDESYTISADDYTSPDEFQRAVVAEIMRLLNL